MPVVDEQKRLHIQDDLQGFFKGDVHFDEVTRGLYSTDASIFQVQPMGVVAPRNEEDVQALVRYAGENGVPLIARGAGTGLAGESLGQGLVVDLSRHFRDIIEIGVDTVRVQPGVVLQRLNAELAREGMRFAPDPASGKVCTIGGMLATNASGTRALRFGYMRDHVAKLRLVLDTGHAVNAGQEAVQPGFHEQSGHWQDILGAMAVVLDQNTDLIEQCRPKTQFNRCGYRLDGVLTSHALDMPRLLVGSEGTLALFTEAELRTIPLPGGEALVLLGYSSLENALEALDGILPTNPVSCDLIDRRLVRLTRRPGIRNRALDFALDAEAVLLVEYEADSEREARQAAENVITKLQRSRHGRVQAVTAWEPSERNQLRQLREIALPSLYDVKDGPQPTPFVEDVAVPVNRLGEYLHGVQAIMQDFEVTASYYVHAGAGQVHTRPFLDLKQPDQVSKLTPMAEQVHALALDLGGTVSSQHGAGLARTPWVARQYGKLFSVFRQIKTIFDPRNLFNPGKIVPGRTSPVGWPLRVLYEPEEKKSDWALAWRDGEALVEAAHCNGCGQCRTEDPAQRMCPIFRATHDEAATPRAKANLVRNVFANGAESASISSNEIRAVADLCVNCKMCAHECPAHINVPKLMLEAKAANVAEHGMDRGDWFMANVETFARWGSKWAPLTNLLLRNRIFRWMMEKMFGLSRRRRLPKLAFRSFLRRAQRRGWTQRRTDGRPELVYFVDVYANYFDPLLAECTAAVLQHAGFDVFVPLGQVGGGGSEYSYGDVEGARERARQNLLVLAELAREGLPIICSEPTAAVMLGRDYLDLINDSDARLVSGQTVELCDFLWHLHEQRKLPPLERPLPFEVGHHVPCHVKSLHHDAAGPKLLSLIPELRVRTIDVSCSGMAGTFGMKAKNVETSLQAGAPMLARYKRDDIRYGSSECSSCRLQMEDAGEKRALHPVQYLALAYNLTPEVQNRLDSPIRDLMVQ